MAADSGTYTPETLARRAKIAEQLLGPSKPITHWAEGLNEMAKGFFGGRMLDRVERDAIAGERSQSEALARLLNPGASTSAAPTEMPAAAPVSADLPRGLRNNNPLNIEAGGFTQGQPGFSGSDGRFARFETPEAGIGAANKLLDVYQNKHGLNSVNGIINRWAPAADGNNVNSYAAAVAKQLGIDPNAPISPEMRPQLIAAMGQHENGRPIGNVAQALQGGQQVAQAGGAPANVPVPGIPGSAPSAIPAGDSRARIAQMLNDPNPYVRKMGQSLAQGVIAKQVEGEKPTDEMREYDLYRRQGGKETFFDYKTGLNKARAQNITIDQKPELSFDTKAGNLQAERYDKIVQSGADAKTMVSDVQALRDLGSRITTGKSAELQAALGPYASSMGIKIDGLDDMQAYKAIISRLAPQMRVPGSGATSDFEMRTFLEALPGLGKEPGGNELISQTLEGLAQHKIAAAEIASKALNKEITRSQAERELRQLPDPLTLWKQSKGKAAAPEAAPTKGAPVVGVTEGGYRFKGGEPSKPESWEKVQ
jgi:hypothetical protein